MATQVPRKPRYIKSLIALSPPAIADGTTYHSLIETAAQTYKRGDIVYIDSNGTVAIATVSSGKVNSAMLGIAKRDASGVTGAAAYVEPFRVEDVYEINLYHTTPASAVLTQATYGVKAYGLYYDPAALPGGTGGAWGVDLINTTVEDGSTALAKVRIIDCPRTTMDGLPNAITDIYAVVHVIILPWTARTDGSNRVSNMQWSSS